MTFPHEIGARLIELDGMGSDQAWSAPPEPGHYVAFGPFETNQQAEAFRDAVVLLTAREA
jgi:hypothetical protein